MEKGVESFSAYLKDVNLPSAEEIHFKTSSSEREDLISPSGNETYINIFWVELKTLGPFLGKRNVSGILHEKG